MTRFQKARVQTAQAQTTRPSAYEEYRIPVAGGELAVLRWPADRPGAPLVAAAHGITANALAWAGVAEALAGRVELVACDLRGRAGSREVVGPFGIDADADDLIAVVDDALARGRARGAGAGRAVLLGHSLGGFVAALAAARHPERVRALVAVDGGLGFPPPPGLDPDAALLATVGPAIAKLDMRFADAAAYLDFHRDHPAFAGHWSPQLTAYLGRDTLALPDGRVASSCVAEVIRADGRQILVDGQVRSAILDLAVPVAFLYAERGIVNQPEGLYTADLLAGAGLDRHPDRIRIGYVEGVNHYTIVGPGTGAETVAAAVLALAEA